MHQWEEFKEKAPAAVPPRVASDDRLSFARSMAKPCEKPLEALGLQKQKDKNQERVEWLSRP